MPTVLRNERATALTYLVGQSRAYLQQLELARRELGDLKAADLQLILQAVDAAEVAVKAINSIGTEKLRRS